jgi:hypothetical protein
MDWNFDDGIWNIETDWKVPRKVLISLGFTILHDGNPGIYPIKGGTERLTEEERNSTTTTDGQRIFGVGRFPSTDDGTEIQVSQAEMRKIFGTVRNED